MKKQSPKLKSTRKPKQDRPFLEILTFSQWSMHKVKVNDQQQCSDQSDPGGIQVFGSILVQVTNLCYNIDDVI